VVHITEGDNDNCFKHERCNDNISRIHINAKYCKRERERERNFGPDKLTKDDVTYMGSRGSFRQVSLPVFTKLYIDSIRTIL
jgi:hypothetical protein